MKVSSRLGDLSGCTVWGPPTPRRSSASPPFPAACGQRRAARRARPEAREGARWRGRGGVSGPGRPGYLGAREGGRGAALACLAWAVSESFLITGVN